MIVGLRPTAASVTARAASGRVATCKSTGRGGGHCDRLKLMRRRGRTLAREHQDMEAA